MEKKTFTYRALNSSGKEVKGQVQAFSRQDAKSALKTSKLVVTEITEYFEKKKSTFFSKRVLSKKFNLALFSRQLATLLRSGLTLEEAFTTMIGENVVTEEQKITEQVREKIYEGESLTQALRSFTPIFPPTFIAMVQAGEESGKLAKIMGQLALLHEEQSALKQKAITSLTYPFFLVLVGFAVVVFLLVKIVPEVTVIFVDSGGDLPLPTLILLSLSHFVGNYWLLSLFFCPVFVVIIKKIYGTTKGKDFFQRIFIRIPFVGRVYKTFLVGQVCSVMGLLLENRVEIVKSFQIVIGVSQNLQLQKDLLQVQSGIVEGKSLTVLIKKVLFFSYETQQMISAGARSDNLPEMFINVARSSESKVKADMDRGIALLEPIMILLLGGVIGFIVMAIFLPIMRMNSLIG